MSLYAPRISFYAGNVLFLDGSSGHHLYDKVTRNVQADKGNIVNPIDLKIKGVRKLFSTIKFYEHVLLKSLGPKGILFFGKLTHVHEDEIGAAAGTPNIRKVLELRLQFMESLMKLVLNEDTMHSETLCHYVILEYLNALKIMKTSNERFRGVYILLVDQLQRELKLSPYM